MLVGDFRRISCPGVDLGVANEASQFARATVRRTKQYLQRECPAASAARCRVGYSHFG